MLLLRSAVWLVCSTKAYFQSTFSSMCASRPRSRLPGLTVLRDVAVHLVDTNGELLDAEKIDELPLAMDLVKLPSAGTIRRDATVSARAPAQPTSRSVITAVTKVHEIPDLSDMCTLTPLLSSERLSIAARECAVTKAPVAVSKTVVADATVLFELSGTTIRQLSRDGPEA